MIASSSLDSHIRIWDIESGKCAKSIDAGPGEIFKIIDFKKKGFYGIFFLSLGTNIGLSQTKIAIYSEKKFHLSTRNYE